MTGDSMTANRPDRFDEVEWSEISRSRWFEPSITTVGLVVTLVPLVVLAGYDRAVLPARTPTLAVVGLEYDLTAVDYLFVATLVLFAWYLVVPLARHPRMTQRYWREFRRNRPAVVGLGWLGIVFVGGLFGPLVVSAPEQSVLIGHQPPAFLSVDAANVATCVGELRDGRCHGTLTHPLGTTQGGKDVFAGIVYGMRISVKIAFITTAIVAAIGVTVGTVSAYAGGWVDEILMRFVDIVLSFPTLLMFLLILYIGTARYVRSKSLSVAEEPFVDASRMSGATTAQVVRRHVVPNTASSIVTQLTLLVPGFLLAEAQLAFLGLGDSAVPSWGQLIAAGRSDLSFAPWIVLAPGLVLFATILSFNFLGDALLDALNPETEAENQ
jgi:peptide/nickel transport system permease protein